MSDALAVCARLLLYVGALLAIGEVASSWVTTRTATNVAKWIALSLLSSVVLLFVAQFLALELSPTSTDVAMLVRQTAWGRGWIVLAACAMVASVLSFASASASTMRVLRSASVVALAIAMSGLGHSAADDSILVARAIDSVHVVGIGAWLGALFALRHLTELTTWRRFSTTASIALATVVVSGVFATWRRVGMHSLRMLVDSDYVQLLALKVLLVGVVIAVGYASRRRIQRGEIPTARTLRTEFAFACIVLITTAWLTGTAPPGE